jgi:transcription initiation factor TFIID subunit 1
VWDCDTESANKMVYPLTMDLNDTNMLFDIIVKKDDRGSNSKNSDFDSRGVKLLKKAKKMGGNRVSNIPILILLLLINFSRILILLVILIMQLKN